MPRLSRTLKELEIELYELGEETMLIEELDGYFAGLLVCPELILPSEWLPPVWSQEKDNQSPGFDDLAHANRVFALIMEQYNNVVVTLMERPERYRPLLPVDGRNGDILWEIWIEGFQVAVALRPTSWQRLLDADPTTAAAMRGLFGLIDLARDVGAVLHPDNDAIVKAAPADIARWIVTLHEYRLANYKPPQGVDPRTPPPPRPKAGRNDPCPCGSGKKYKRCCGLN